MEVTIIYVQVTPEHIQDFIEATRVNHEASLHEAGNLRFDVLQSEEDPGHFVLYEAYQGPEHVDAHKQTPHYLNWRETVAPWMAEARRSVRYKGLFPAS